MTTCGADFVVLKGGLVLPMAAIRLAIDLEARGIHLAVEGAFLRVGPSGQVTDDDCQQITRWKRHLLALAVYDADAHKTVPELDERFKKGWQS